jgi:hypothetical protein
MEKIIRFDIYHMNNFITFTYDKRVVDKYKEIPNITIKEIEK